MGSVVGRRLSPFLPAPYTDDSDICGIVVLPLAPDVSQQQDAAAMDMQQPCCNHCHFRHSLALPAGYVHLDQVPFAAARPYSEAKAQQGQQAGGGQQQRQQGSAEPAPPLAWLGGLLFGRRRGDTPGGAQPKPLDPATWREFEKDFTEV